MKHQHLLVPLCAVLCATPGAATPSLDVFFDIATSGHPRELEKMLATGVAIDARNEQGATALMRAVIAANNTTARALIENGADITITDSLGRDALDWALVTGSLEMARLLVAKGADLDRVDKKGNTRLTAAAARDDIPTVTFLLMNGADKNATSSRGMTPAAVAKKHKHQEVLRLISEHTTFTPPPAAPRLSTADSLRLHATTRYTDRNEFFAAIQEGRRCFSGCTLQELDLSNMNLSTLVFRGADLTGADLRNSLLRGTDLSNATLRASYLKRADLEWATLEGADLTDAYLNEAIINNVTGLGIEQLRFVRTVFNAQMPEEFVAFFEERHRDKLEKDPGSAWDTNPWSQDVGKRSLRDWFVQPKEPAPASTP